MPVKNSYRITTFGFLKGISLRFIVLNVLNAGVTRKQVKLAISTSQYMNFWFSNVHMIQEYLIHISG